MKTAIFFALVATALAAPQFPLPYTFTSGSVPTWYTGSSSSFIPSTSFVASAPTAYTYSVRSPVVSSAAVIPSVYSANTFPITYSAPVAVAPQVAVAGVIPKTHAQTPGSSFTTY